MAITPQISCDICHKVKDHVNHWWMVEDTEEEFKLLPWFAPDQEQYSHVCGAECATKFLSKWMQKEQN